MANSRVGSFGLQVGPKTGHIKQIESELGQLDNLVLGRIRWAHIFYIKKTTNKCQIFRENESNQIVRLFVTNLLLWEKHKQTKKHKDFHILAIQMVLTFEHN